MTDFAALEAAVRAKTPPIQFPGASPAEQVSSGFVMAREAIFKYVPAGTMLSYDEAVLANQKIGQHIEDHGDEIRPYIEAGQDLHEALAFYLTAAELRQFILAQYSLACVGIGAFVSGWADQSVKLGTLSQQDYLEGIATRIETFSQIVRLDESGQLETMLRGEQTAERVVMSTPQGRIAAGPLQKLPPGALLVLKSGPLTVKLPASGLGYIGPAAVAGIVIVVIAAVVALVVYSLQKKRIEASARVMQQVCSDAAKAGNKEAIEACAKYASGLSDKSAIDDLIPKGVQEQLTKWLLIGGGLYIVLKFGPEIVDAAFATKKRYVERKAGAT